MKKAILIFGKPGAGKGTQADRIGDKFGLVHFDTGKEIERTVHDPALQSDSVIQRERQLFDSGVLATPEWVRDFFMERIREIAGSGKGLIFSGAPRTLYEIEAIAPLLKELYGNTNVIVFLLNIKDETAIFRNSHRRVCKECRRPVLWSPETESQTVCAICGGELVRRTLDTEAVIRERLREYRMRTEPVIQYLREHGFTMYEVDGEPMPDEITKSLFEKLGE